MKLRLLIGMLAFAGLNVQAAEYLNRAYGAVAARTTPVCDFVAAKVQEPEIRGAEYAVATMATGYTLWRIYQVCTERGVRLHHPKIDKVLAATLIQIARDPSSHSGERLEIFVPGALWGQTRIDVDADKLAADYGTIKAQIEKLGVPLQAQALLNAVIKARVPENMWGRDIKMALNKAKFV